MLDMENFDLAQGQYRCGRGHSRTSDADLRKFYPVDERYVKISTNRRPAGSGAMGKSESTNRTIVLDSRIQFLSHGGRRFGPKPCVPLEMEIRGQ